VRGSRSAIALDLVDASALLWRLYLCGHDVGDRWGELSLALKPHSPVSRRFLERTRGRP